MKLLHKLLILGAVMVPAGTIAGTIPLDCDMWTEYADANAAQADGWLVACGISQQATVSTDCMVASFSVGCRSTRAYWCDEFGIEKEVPLESASSLKFWHKAAWPDWNFAVRIYMQPSSAEAAEGVTVKRLSFNFPSSTTWVHHVFQFEDGQWDWRVNNMWQSGDFEETPTELVSIQWYFCRYYGVTIGDEMLIDGLCFQTQESGVLAQSQPVQLLAPAPNPFNPATNIRFTLEDSEKLVIAIYSVDGELVKIIADQVFEEGLQQVFWNGCDGAGHTMPAGIYLVHLGGKDLELSQKLALVR